MYTVLHKGSWGVSKLAKFADIKELMGYVDTLEAKLPESSMDDILVELENGKRISVFNVDSIMVLRHRSDWERLIEENAYEPDDSDWLPRSVLEDQVSVMEREVRCLREEKHGLENERHVACLEIAKLVNEKSRLENENINLEKSVASNCKKKAEYYYESIRNRIEADLWKLIFEYGLEDLLDKFYIHVPEERNSWRYIHFLVNEDYDGGRPEFDVSEQFSSGRVVIIWYRDNENFDAELEFDNAVRNAMKEKYLS